MKWFRFYSEVLEDEKIQTLPLETRWGWVCVLCLANEGQPRGTLPPLKRVAFRLRVSEKKAQALLDSLVSQKLLDVQPDGSLQPHNWESRQRKSDDAGAVNKDQRDKHAVRGHVHGQWRRVSMDCPADVHPRVRAETDKDLDQDERSDERSVRPSDSPEDHQACVELALELFGDAAANAVERKRLDIRDELEGRFDLYAAALRAAKQQVDQPGAPAIRNLHALCMAMAREWFVTGIPDGPVEVKGKPEPERPELRPIKAPEWFK